MSACSAACNGSVTHALCAGQPRNGGLSSGRLPPVAERAMSAPDVLRRVALFGLRNNGPGRPVRSRTGVWRALVAGDAAGMSCRSLARALRRSHALRELTGIGPSERPYSRDTLRRCRAEFMSDGVLAGWLSAVHAHCRPRGLPSHAELDLIWEASGLRALAVSLDRHGLPGRNGHAPGPLVRAYVAQACLGMGATAELHRRLTGDPGLAAWCGFEPGRTPSYSTLRRSEERILRRIGLIVDAQRGALAELLVLLPGFARQIAIDRTFLPAWSRHRKTHGDGSDPDADVGFRRRNDRGGTELALGYGLHAAVDAVTGVPLCTFAVAASVHESPTLPALLRCARSILPEARTEAVSADAGYFSRRNAESAVAGGAVPVIAAKRNRGGEFTTAPCRICRSGRSSCGASHQRMRYDGTPICRCGEPMEFAAHTREADWLRRSQVWRCPACCGAPAVAVEWALDPMLTPYWPRSSREYREAYRRHQAVERFNYLLKGAGRFVSGHRLRGLGKVGLRVQFAVLIMQARAVASLRDGRPRDIRRVVLPVP